MTSPKGTTSKSPRHSQGKSNPKISPLNQSLLDSLNAAREEPVEVNAEEEEKKQKIREKIKSWGRNLGTDTPFMDYFSDRADYSVGAFYGAHRRVLWDCDRTTGSMGHTNSLEPPIEAKTRAQSRRNRSRGGLPAVHINDTPVEELPTLKPKIKKMMHMNLKKVATLVKDSIILEHYSTVDESAWTEEVLAGVRVWINRHTGEVSTTCPWRQDALKHMNMPLAKKGGNNEEKIDDLGTGSLVYSAAEFDELERVLNGGKVGK